MNANLTSILLLCSIINFSSITFSQDTVRTQKKDPDNLDVKLFRTINNNRSKLLDNLLPITDKTVFPIAIALPLGMIAYGEIGKKYYDGNTGVLLALSLVLSEGTTFGLKYIVKRKRPYMSLDNVYKRDISLSDPYSFPSGHTNTAFTITTMFMLRYVKYPYIYVPMYAWSLIVAYGRSYFGMHYPADLLGGAIIGTLSSALIYSLRSEIIKAKNNLFNEPGKPDKNTKFIGYFIGAALITSILNENIFHSGNVNIDLGSSSSLTNSVAISCRIRL